MKKIALTTVAMSAVLVIAGCSSSGSNRFGHAKHASYSNCPTCGQGSYAVQHGHRNQRSSGGGSGIATVAGALLVGGLLYNALDDDDSSGSTHVK